MNNTCMSIQYRIRTESNFDGSTTYWIEQKKPFSFGWQPYPCLPCNSEEEARKAVDYLRFEKNKKDGYIYDL